MYQTYIAKIMHFVEIPFIINLPLHLNLVFPNIMGHYSRIQWDTVLFSIVTKMLPQMICIPLRNLLNIKFQSCHVNSAFLMSEMWKYVTGGWEFDRSHGAGTFSPSHWQQVEEQAPKPVGWTMCFLLMTLVPVQKLCVNIYVYIYVLSLYELCYRSYIKRDCHSVLAKLHPITFFWGMRGSWSECHFVFSLVYQLCLALW